MATWTLENLTNEKRYPILTKRHISKHQQYNKLNNLCTILNCHIEYIIQIKYIQLALLN